MLKTKDVQSEDIHLSKQNPGDKHGCWICRELERESAIRQAN